MNMKRRDFIAKGGKLALGALVGGHLVTAGAGSEPRPEASEKAFPPKFLWGAATAGHQVEGNNLNSDIWLLEHTKGGMYEVPSGDACDHYHLYEQDINMLADLGFNAYRFSIEWSRIEPEPGMFSRAELEHYNRMLEACHRQGLTPLVTYSHFSVPKWFAWKGSWENPESPERFADFCDKATRHLGDLIAYAATFNEPDIADLLRWVTLPGAPEGADLIMRMAAAKAEVRKQLSAPEFSSFFFGEPETVRSNMMAAHRKGKAAIKAVKSNLPVGLTLAMEDDQSANGGDRADKKRADVYEPWLKLAREDDFVGVQTYTRQLVGAKNLPSPKDAEVTQMGYEFYPESLEHTIRYASKVAGVPVIVTENGVATENDERRVEYIRRALQGVKRCTDDGIEVRGYIHWSLLDNFEWIFGYRPKFGLIAVDRETQKRTVKPSAVMLGRIAQNNGF